MICVQAENVGYAYNRKNVTTTALNGFTRDFEYGRVYAVVGKSGSGKTTLLNLLADMDTPTEGRVLFQGEDLRTKDVNDYRQKDVSVIFQSFNLIPHLTVLENAMIPLRLSKMPKNEAAKYAKEKLSSVGLTERHLKSLPSQISGGEQQRAAVARALCSSAKLLLADEPTGNLDTENSAKLMDVFSDLAKNNGFCVIVATHDAELAERADERLVLRDGVLASGDRT